MPQAIIPTQTTLSCAVCGADFVVRSAYLRHRQTNSLPSPKYCGRSCMGRGQAKPPTRQLIETESIPEPNSGCWLWLGSINPGNGYGRVGLAGIPAHRAAYEAYKGSIPPKLVVRHTCDNPLCVNPDHLLVGTPADNKLDAVLRRRHAHGETLGTAKLRNEDAAAIRSRLRAGERQCAVARDLGLSHGIVHRIASRRSWRHIA